MPRMNGLEAARRLRALWPWVPLVFVSAFCEYAPEGYGLRAFRYLCKDRLEQLLEGRPFLRTQRSYYVNLCQVQRLRRFEFVLRSGRGVPVSERRYGRVRAEYLEWQARFEEWATRF